MIIFTTRGYVRGARVPPLRRPNVGGLKTRITTPRTCFAKRFRTGSTVARTVHVVRASVWLGEGGGNVSKKKKRTSHAARTDSPRLPDGRSPPRGILSANTPSRVRAANDATTRTYADADVCKTRVCSRRRPGRATGRRHRGAGATVAGHVPGHPVPAHRRRGRLVLLRAGGRPAASHVDGVRRERGADGVVVRVGARAHAGGRVPRGADTGRRVAVPVRRGVAGRGTAVPDRRGRAARLGGRGGALRTGRRPLGQHRRPPHADAGRHHTDQQVTRRRSKHVHMLS